MMYSKSNLKSLIDKSKSVESIIIPRSLNGSDKSKLKSEFNQRVKLNSSDDVLLIFARL